MGTYYAPFPPDPTRPEPFGGDFSKYNGHHNWSVAKVATVPLRYAINRGGQSWGYIDPLYVDHMQGQIAAGIPAMTYWVIFPGQPVTDQVNKCLEALQLIDWEQPYAIKKLWIDLELHHNQSRTVIMSKTWNMICQLQDALPDWEIGVYSGEWFLSGYCEWQDWVTKVKWWMAHYLDISLRREHPGPPARPSWLPSNAVWIHQVSSNISSMLYGWLSEVGTNERMDGNRFLKGGVDELNQWLGIQEVEPEPDDCNARLDAVEARMDVVEAKLNQWVDIVDGLHQHIPSTVLEAV